MTIPLLIGKERVLSKRTIGIQNPSTEEIIDTVSAADKNDVERAIIAAKKGFLSYKEVTLSRRIDLLREAAKLIRKNKEELAKTMSIEIGRPIKSARAEIERTAYSFELGASYVGKALEGKSIRLDQFIWPAENEKRISLTLREPIGTVLAITPFNFPAAAAAQKIVPSLAVGNSVIIKPSISAPLTIFKLIEILTDLEFPPGVLNYITGYSQEIGDQLVQNMGIQGITFTGSSNVGLDIASKAVRTGKRILMELGSSDPFIVLPDADLRLAARFAAFARFDYAGQYCNAAKRFYVASEIFEEFINQFVKETEKLKIGNPLDETTDIGPLINRDAVKNYEETIKDVKEQKGRIIIGGYRIERKGFFVSPTIVTDIRPNMRVINEETFYPIAPVMKFDSESELLSLINKSEYGLDASIFTKNFGKAFKLAREIDTGTVLINDHTRLRWDGAPFGGVNKSGFGKESIYDSMIELTREKLIVTNLENY
ncbi:MAG: aldehyde dehydrogenase family protein [Conexivisphaerales archaeon]